MLNTNVYVLYPPKPERVRGLLHRSIPLGVLILKNVDVFCERCI